MKYYAGIGSRSTPPEFLSSMTEIASRLYRNDYILRSGFADGADQAFEAGVPRPGGKEIYLPWPHFNGSQHQDGHHSISDAPAYLLERAMHIAEQAHPAWYKCAAGARKLHARNSFQILGADLETPCEFVICWTPRASGSGGTGQATRIANMMNIPVYDLASASQTEAFLERLHLKIEGNPNG